MSKYTPLAEFLEKSKKTEIPMNFKDIENLIGGDLPASSKKYPAWWSNESTTHVQAVAWKNAGYKTTEVDLEGETLVFRRIPKTPPAAPAVAENPDAPHPLFGCLKGVITIPDDLDLTQPADPEWGARTYGSDD